MAGSQECRIAEFEGIYTTWGPPVHFADDKTEALEVVGFLLNLHITILAEPGPGFRFPTVTPTPLPFVYSSIF